MVSAQDSQSDGPRVRVSLWPLATLAAGLAGFVFVCPEFKFSQQLPVKRLQVTSRLLKFQSFCSIWFVCFLIIISI